QDGRRTTARQPPIEISLIESATRILPDWGKKLRAQAESVLEESGIGVLTKTAVTRVGKDRIYLSARRSITTGTVIWCGGLRGLPVYESIGAPLDKKGRLRVNPYLHLPQYRNIFAMGDAINTEAFAMPVPRSGQAAYQQAKVIANNILSSESGKPLRRFTYSEVGEVMPVGGRRAIARILRVPLEGNPAWILEKAIFVMRVPGWSNKVKLLSGLALDPLVERGEEYLEKRGW
ncbi:MAG: FAD-dependent oxidoreductase, partial [Candidatus Hydrogenedentota bacterium]